VLAVRFNLRYFLLVKNPVNKSFKNKKVLVFGLGLLGGGVATTNWLLKQGAKVTVTDLKDEKVLASSLKKIKGKVKLVLGGHSEKDIKENEFIVVNPDVSINNKYVQLALKLGKKVENEATIFLKSWQKPTVAVTGTRGKTTTTNWTAHFLKSRYRATVAGNSYSKPFLKILDRKNKFQFAALEIPSFALEFFVPLPKLHRPLASRDRSRMGQDSTLGSTSALGRPDVAVITNVYQDHLNRHGSLREYALVKASIFRNQKRNQNLILNFDNEWTKLFLKQKPKSRIWFFSGKTLPKKLNGIYVSEDKVYFQNSGKKEAVLEIADFSKNWGRYNVLNLLASSLAAHLSGIDWQDIQKNIETLPQIAFRQETIYDNGKIKIINDTTATSPDGGIAALERFGSPTTILIAGGTDRQLDYKGWVKVVVKNIKKENIILLSGSATQKMRDLINCGEALDSLAECLKTALRKAGKFSKSVVLFSPAAKSFEKFKNEYDRGKQFNNLVKKLVKKETKVEQK